MISCSQPCSLLPGYVQVFQRTQMLQLSIDVVPMLIEPIKPSLSELVLAV